MRRRLRALLGLVALTITSAHAEPPFRVRGTITSVDGNVPSVGVVPKVGIETPTFGGPKQVPSSPPFHFGLEIYITTGF